MSNEEKLITKVDDSVDVPNPVGDLPPKIQRFIHLYITGQYGLNQLAQLLEVHPNTVTNWLKRKDVKQAISDIQSVTHDVVQSQMKSLTLKAVERMRELMDSPIDGVALQAVKDVLDRAGHKPKQEIKKDITVTTFEEKLNKLIDDVIDIDVDYVELDDEDVEKIES